MNHLIKLCLLISVFYTSSVAAFVLETSPLFLIGNGIHGSLLYGFDDDRAVGPFITVYNRNDIKDVSQPVVSAGIIFEALENGPLVSGNYFAFVYDIGLKKIAHKTQFFDCEAISVGPSQTIIVGYRFVGDGGLSIKIGVGLKESAIRDFNGHCSNGEAYKYVDNSSKNEFVLELKAGFQI